MISFSHTRRVEGWLRIFDILLIAGWWVVSSFFPAGYMHTEGYVTGLVWYLGIWMVGGQNPLYLFPRYRIFLSMSFSLLVAFIAAFFWSGVGYTWYKYGALGAWVKWRDHGGLLSLIIIGAVGLMIRLVMSQIFRRPAIQLIPCRLPKIFQPLLDELSRHPHIITEPMLENPTDPLPERHSGYPIYLAVSTLQMDATEFNALSPLFERVEVADICHLYESMLEKIPFIRSSGEWVLPQALNIPSPTRELLKRAGDIAVVILTAPITLLILLLAAAAVKLTSRGPVFYRQERLGQYGRKFRIVKLRTMVNNAETAGPQWTKAGDPRVTPTGWVLRATAIDELPQFWNVLLGQMSLIGPRPERPELVEHLEHEIPFYRARLLVPPGVTGWAQLHQGGDMTIEDVEHKLQYDLYYLKYGSSVLDIKILLGTIQMLFHMAKPRISGGTK